MSMETPSRLHRFIEGKRALPDEQRQVFDDLFLRKKSDEEVCKDFGWSLETFVTKRDAMLRNLRAVAA